MNRVILLSAGPADGSARDSDRPAARPQWMRDAVLAISRAALQRGLRLRISAHPVISPMVLTVAREFPPPDAPPVEVYRSKFFSGRDAMDIHELADWQLGILEETEARADEASSVAALRDAMLSRPGLLAAVFVGGSETVRDEAELFRKHHPDLPAYAIASTGGAAADLLGLFPHEFAGGDETLKESGALGEERIGYTRVARAVFESIERMRVRRVAAAPVPRVRGYEIVRVLGRGARTTVVAATRLADQKAVVLKIVTLEGDEMTRARALKPLGQPPTVAHGRVIAASRWERLPDNTGIWLEMERYRESLHDLLANRGAPLPPVEARRIVLDALDGLAALHAAGIAHGAIHPANVLIRDDGSGAIVDRGLAAVSADDHAADPAYPTRSFIAPEMLDGNAPATPASDVWSMAATLYVALTRHAPRAEPDGAIASARGQPIVKIATRRAELPMALADSVERALSVEPSHRPRDAGAFRDQLGADAVTYGETRGLIDQAELLYNYCFREIPLEIGKLPYEPRSSCQCEKHCAALWVATKSGTVMRVDVPTKRNVSTERPRQSWLHGTREARAVYHQHHGRALQPDTEAEDRSFLLVGRDDGALDIIPDDHAGWTPRPSSAPSAPIASFYLDAWWDRDRHFVARADKGVGADGDDRDRYDAGVTAILVLDRPGAPGAVNILVATRRLYVYVIEAAGGQLHLRERLAMPGWINWIIAPRPPDDPRVAFVARSGEIVWRAPDQLSREIDDGGRAELAALPTAALPFDGTSLLLGTSRGLYYLDPAHPEGMAIPVTRSAVLCLGRAKVRFGHHDRDYVSMGLADGTLRVVEVPVIRKLAGIKRADRNSEDARTDPHRLHNFSKPLVSPVLVLETLHPTDAPDHAAYVAAVLRDHRIRLYHVTSQPVVQGKIRGLWNEHVRCWFGAVPGEHSPAGRVAAELATAEMTPPSDKRAAWMYMLADVVLHDLRAIAPIESEARSDAVVGRACRLTDAADRVVLQRLSAAMGELTAIPSDHDATADHEESQPRVHVGLLLQLSLAILAAVPKSNDLSWLGFIENHLLDLDNHARHLGDSAGDHGDRARLIAWTRFVRKYVLLGDTFASKRVGLETLIALNCETSKYLDALIYQAQLAQRGYDLQWESVLAEDIATVHVVRCPIAWGWQHHLVVAVTVGGKLAAVDSAGPRPPWDVGQRLPLLMPFGRDARIQVHASAVAQDDRLVRVVIACTGDDAPPSGLAVIELRGTSGEVLHLDSTTPVPGDDDSPRVYAIEPLPAPSDAFMLGLGTAGWPVGLLTRRHGTWSVECTKDEAPAEGVDAGVVTPTSRSSLAPGEIPTRALAVAVAPTDGAPRRYLAVAGSDDGLVRAISFNDGEHASGWKLRRWDRMTDAITSVALHRHGEEQVRGADEFSCYLGTAAGDAIALSILPSDQAGAGIAVSPFGDYSAQPRWRDTLDGAVVSVQLWRTPELYDSSEVLAVATDRGRMCLYNHVRQPHRVSSLSNYYFRGLRLDRMSLPGRLRSVSLVDGGRGFVAAGPDGKLYMGRCVYLRESRDRDDAAEAPLAQAQPAELPSSLPSEMWARLRWLFQRHRHDEYFHDEPVDHAGRTDLKLRLCDAIRVEGGAVSSYALHQRLLHHQPWNDVRHEVQQFLDRLDPEQPAGVAQIKIVLKALGRKFLDRDPRELRRAILKPSVDRDEPERRARAAVVCEVLADCITRRFVGPSAAAARLRITAIKELLRVTTLLYMARGDKPGARIASAVESAVAACLRDDQKLVRIEVLRALSVVLRNVRTIAETDGSLDERERIIREVFPDNLGSLEWLLSLLLESLRRVPSFTERTALVSTSWYLIAALLPLFRIFPDFTLALCDYLTRAGLSVEVLALCFRSLRGPAAARIRSRIAHLYLLPGLKLEKNGRDEFLARYDADNPGHRALLDEMDLPPPRQPTPDPGAPWYELDDSIMAARLTKLLHRLARMWRASDKDDIRQLGSAEPALDTEVGANAWNDLRTKAVPNVPLAPLEHVVNQLAFVAQRSDRRPRKRFIPFVLECLAELGAPQASNVRGELLLTAPIRTISSGIVGEWRRALAPKVEKGQEVGGYKLGKRLHRGTFSNVYVTRNGRVIKVLCRWDDLDAVTNFLRGARFAAELARSTPHIVRIDDLIDEEFRAYVMPRYQGDLQRYLRDRFHEQANAVVWAERAALHIGHALQLVHARGCCHGDVNAANILVSTSSDANNDIAPEFALNDFDRLSSTSSTNEQRGGRTWLADEVLPRSTSTVPRLLSMNYTGNPRNQLRQWEDVIALALVLYQMLTGETVGSRGPADLHAATTRLRQLGDRIAGRARAERLVQELIKLFDPAAEPTKTPAKDFHSALAAV